MVSSKLMQILSKTPKRAEEHLINEKIFASQVRLVGNNVTMGVYPIDEALKLARNLELDLVEISPNVDPPICKIVDYKKFIYEKKRKEKEIKSHAKHSEVKEIRFTPGTDDHDFDFKCKHAEKFLKDGDKVKAFVQFRGRSIMFQDRGQLLLLKFAERLTEFGQLESLPKIDGKKMIAIFVPKSQKKK
ncbi:MAG: translation initiation factor IF-3 [Sediminibacterium sp.]|nr:translation initiation factor IF-3 [Sediminibacterium sp.]